MSNFGKTLVSILTAWVIVVGAFLIHEAYRIEHNLDNAPTAGSVALGNDYRFYTASSTSASSTAPIVLKTRPGSLGSITVASTTSGSIFRVYDSAAATSAPAQIVALPISPTAGTYTFDVSFNTGLVLDIPAGFNGIYTVSYR